MRFSIGTDDFKEIRTDEDSSGKICFYCDKSLLIKDIIDDGAKVIVLPRPRRFGKTLNLSMLKYFFDMTEDNSGLFEGLKITDHKNIMEKWQGKYPVVFISFKDLRPENYTVFIEDLKKYISECYKNFKYLLESPRLDDDLKKKLMSYQDENFKTNNIKESLWYLTKALKEHHGKEAVVLMDEYDTPLQEAYVNKYFDKAIKPFRAMMGKVFKGNEFLYKGVITGITRIARESLFSGVNNLQVYDITRDDYAQYFGFTEEEVQQVCDPAHFEALKSWYNGYTFGDTLIIYNPWSVLHFLKNRYKFEPYWINASSNDLIKESLTADKLEGVETLISGQSLDVEIEPFTVMSNLKGNATAFWNLLFMAGFLTLDADRKLRIPNQEIQYFFEKIVKEWFGGRDDGNYLQDFLDALLGGDNEGVQSILDKIVKESFSFKDSTKKQQESFYHGILLGITLSLKQRYKVKSNRESGYGLFDIALFPKDPLKDPGVIIEIKIRGSVDKAMEQIQIKEYSTELKEDGCQTICLYSMKFDGKRVKTKLVTERI